MELDTGETQSAVEVKKWDRVGIMLSLACALHCLLTPFLTLSLPYWIYTIHYSPFHLIIALFIVPVGLFAFWSGYRRHQNKFILTLGVAGLFLILISLTGPSSRSQLRWNDVLTLIGSGCLIIAHFFNRRSNK
ncbi:MAG: MerC domain-containing protein [Bdellovibrionaceae bacterium]|nr:MerC domain-containing protein [Pseudobdellovibrionaceae bacterium]